ncbi:hypothetical protein DUNSADRAFT_6916 [Dunaliella salina]|uniref:Uncharacterized protein n=1 Tax=Dunaliella salina TaxID=3046 RepID=A0ABQ7GME6_DUNSA|nr:hypothetical protein DUNSADRAFT_6916 [Dunaliella salina]|eukprot:KAF5835776.1 hypothetical protein DUNSADRAFT_6916 [Dunaliella salina]
MLLAIDATGTLAVHHGRVDHVYEVQHPAENCGCWFCVRMSVMRQCGCWSYLTPRVLVMPEAACDQTGKLLMPPNTDTWYR